MKLKVIKEIKGLVPGDILDYNKEEQRYEIYKVDEEIVDNKITKKSMKVSIGEYLVNDFKDYFIYLDEEGNELTISEIRYSDSDDYKEKLEKDDIAQHLMNEPDQPSVKSDSESDKLNIMISKNEELFKEIEELKERIDRIKEQYRENYAKRPRYWYDYWFV
jgi:HD superfamily phosphohydrolase